MPADETRRSELANKFGLRNVDADWLRQTGHYSIPSLIDQIASRDLCAISRGSLPFDISTALDCTLGTPVLAQVEDVINLCAPDNPRGRGLSPSTLLVHLSDGRQNFAAIELLPLGGRLNVFTTPGSKIKLLPAAMVRRGRVLLTPQTLETFGRTGPSGNVWGGEYEEKIAEAMKRAGMQAVGAVSFDALREAPLVGLGGIADQAGSDNEEEEFWTAAMAAEDSRTANQTPRSANLTHHQTPRRAGGALNQTPQSAGGTLNQALRSDGRVPSVEVTAPRGLVAAPRHLGLAPRAGMITPRGGTFPVHGDRDGLAQASGARIVRRAHDFAGAEVEVEVAADPAIDSGAIVEQTQDMHMATQLHGSQALTQRGLSKSLRPLYRLDMAEKSVSKRSFLVRAFVGARPRFPTDKVGIRLCLMDGSDHVAFYVLKGIAAAFALAPEQGSTERMTGSQRRAFRLQVWGDGCGFYELKKDLQGKLNIIKFLDEPQDGIELFVTRHSAASRHRLDRFTSVL